MTLGSTLPLHVDAVINDDGITDVKVKLRKHAFYLYPAMLIFCLIIFHLIVTFRFIASFLNILQRLFSYFILF